MKTQLANTQTLTRDGKVTNFEYRDELQGSATYRRMTGSLQSAIDVLSDKTSEPIEIRKALEELQKDCQTYQKEHDSIWSGNYGNKRTVRQAQAENALKEIPVMLQTYDHLRVKMAEFTDANGKAYSYKSLSDAEKIVDKAKKDQLIPDEAKNYAEDITAIDNISSAQVSVRNALKEKFPLMAEHYEPYRSGSYYLALLDKPSASDVARMVTVKNFMDKVYDKNAGRDRIVELKEEVTSGRLEAEAEKLAKDPVFKLAVKYFPRRSIEKWNEIETIANTIQADYRNQYQTLMNKGMTMEGKNAPYASVAELLAWDNHDHTAAADAFTKEILASPSGKRIARILAVATPEERTNMINDMKNLGAEYLEKTVRNLDRSFKDTDSPEKRRQKIMDTFSSPKLKQNFMEKLLKSRETEFKRVNELTNLKANQAAPQAPAL
jgi:hypothetical protein